MIQEHQEHQMHRTQEGVVRVAEQRAMAAHQTALRDRTVEASRDAWGLSTRALLGRVDRLRDERHLRVDLERLQTQLDCEEEDHQELRMGSFEDGYEAAMRGDAGGHLDAQTGGHRAGERARGTGYEAFRGVVALYEDEKRATDEALDVARDEGRRACLEAVRREGYDEGLSAGSAEAREGSDSD
jgi:hypothetical protein